MSCPLRHAPAVDPGLTVVKYGGSVLGGPQGIRRAAVEIAGRVARGERMVAVVSALNGRTNRLFENARALASPPDPAHLIPLLATGEAESVRLLAIAVSALGVRYATAGPEGSHVITEGDPLEGEPSCVDVAAIAESLARASVLVTPGFLGRGPAGEPTLLGRGGGDLTAVALSAALRPGQTDLVKDVDGVYDRPPQRAGARRFHTVSWGRLGLLEGGVVQPRAARFAERFRVGFRVRSFSGAGTVVCAGPDRCA